MSQKVHCNKDTFLDVSIDYFFLILRFVFSFCVIFAFKTKVLQNTHVVQHLCLVINLKPFTIQYTDPSLHIVFDLLCYEFYIITCTMSEIAEYT